MNKYILIVFLVLLAGIGSLYFAKPNGQSKMILVMMSDLQGVQSARVAVPVDNQWHKQLAFDKTDGQHVVYTAQKQQLQRNGKTVALDINSLRVRRASSDPDVLEVQIQAKNKATLMSNFKMRLTGVPHE